MFAILIYQDVLMEKMLKIADSSSNSNRRRPKTFLALILALLATISMGENSSAKQALFDPVKKIVVLDPGHGGNDKGSRGAAGTLEKAMTLTMARRLAAMLEDEYRVVLTRTDDYQLDIAERASAANHLDADLFISLHTGAGFTPRPSGITIFYYSPLTDSEEPMAGNLPRATIDKTAPIPWNRIQESYLKASRTLAEIMQGTVSRAVRQSKCDLQGAAILLLESVAMPAILIEAGYLTNPTDEKALQNPDHLEALAKGIAKGIKDFSAAKK